MGRVSHGWKLRCLLFLASCSFVAPVLGQATFPLRPDGLPAWVKQVGARHSPKSRRIFSGQCVWSRGGRHNKLYPGNPESNRRLRQSRWRYR